MAGAACAARGRLDVAAKAGLGANSESKTQPLVALDQIPVHSIMIAQLTHASSLTPRLCWRRFNAQVPALVDDEPLSP